VMLKRRLASALISIAATIPTASCVSAACHAVSR